MDPKKPSRSGTVQNGRGGYLTSDLLNEAGLESLDGNPDALDGAVGQLDADALQVRLEATLGGLGHVRADTAALLGDTFTVNDTARGRAFSSDGTNSGHGFP